ncbi:MAG: ClpXP protease specificity-enhancing factor [Coxiella sp. RIFCSPHIGHO2_12_FULL_42_15]|nr:MAG: ClpXP protease specificity-enhancing factor [Coxiella sp. RIFCSPHIGHO2_12_FULL_42_15]
MTSSRPYLIRAIYEWLVDNRLTPYIMVDATDSMTRVPAQYVEDGKIVLNIEPEAVANLRLSNEVVEFDARFSGISHHLLIPVRAVKAIYAFENGRGMVFSEDDDDHLPPEPPQTDRPDDTDKKSGGRPSLKIVK